MLRDDDLCPAFVHVFDDPVGIKSLVGDQAAEFDILDQGRDADGVEAVAGQQDEPHQIPKRVGQCEDRKSTRLNSSHTVISYAVFCLKKKKQNAAPVTTI